MHEKCAHSTSMEVQYYYSYGRDYLGQNGISGLASPLFILLPISSLGSLPIHLPLTHYWRT